MPWSLANAGKSWRWASPGGAASVLPSRSFGVAMALDFHIHMLSGVLSKTAPTIFTRAPCAILGMTTAASANPMSARRSEEHTSELQSLAYLVCRLLLEKKKTKYYSEVM